MGAKCSRVVIDVIPEKEVMLRIVDRLIQLEQLLKKGQNLTEEQQREKKKLEKVAKVMKSVKLS
jgi:hypothetical protein